MEEYRAYFGHDEHFNGFEPLVSADDATAILQVKQLNNEYGVEVWHGARLIVCLTPSTK